MWRLAVPRRRRCHIFCCLPASARFENGRAVHCATTSWWRDVGTRIAVHSLSSASLAYLLTCGFHHLPGPGAREARSRVAFRVKLSGEGANWHGGYAARHVRVRPVWFFRFTSGFTPQNEVYLCDRDGVRSNGGWIVESKCTAMYNTTVVGESVMAIRSSGKPRAQIALLCEFDVVETTEVSFGCCGPPRNKIVLCALVPACSPSGGGDVAVMSLI